MDKRILPSNGREWHLADIRCAAIVCPLSDQSGQRAVVGPGRFVRLPKRTFTTVGLRLWRCQRAERASLFDRDDDLLTGF